VSQGPRHIAVFYRDEHEYVASVLPFVTAALRAGQRALIAVPSPRLGLLRRALGGDARHVAFADMAEVGRNPARLIPWLQDFLDQRPGSAAVYVGEPARAGRGPDELREAARHEALINVAFDGAAVTVICPYDIAGLPAGVLTDAECTHPAVARDGTISASAAYADDSGCPAGPDQPLAAPPPGAETHRYRTKLSRVRALVTSRAEQAGLPPNRAADLVLAASEVAANTVCHTLGDGTLTIWHDAREIVCEFRDSGVITDPLAGRRRPLPGSSSGHGLWLVNQVCDLVELRSGERGTTIRLHMSTDSQ
jgi:anti-sigma regulatory factor (Ser/Thr protein kinase)